MLFIEFLKSRLKKKSRKGFTLIELTIALTVFLVFLGIIMRSFIYLLGVQIEANRYRKVYAEVEQIVRIIRSDTRDLAVDYGCILEGTCQAMVNTESAVQQRLGFVSGDSLRRVDYFLDYSSEEPEIRREERSRISLDSEYILNSDTELVFNSSQLKEIYLSVFPDEDPFVGDLLETNYQPRIDLALSVVPDAYPDREPLGVQTTITSRFYKATSN